MSPAQRSAFGPYELGPQLASGSFATVHLGVRRGPLGFRRVVAIKRLHAELSRDADAVAMLLAEARLAAQLRHPLIVPAIDVVDGAHGVALIAEYVDGLSLSALRAEAWPPPVPVAIAILCDVCTALSALHRARAHSGDALGIVHRDVSPKNVLVGADGWARLIDLGVAKSMRRGHESVAGALKGTLAYLAPEQIDGSPVDARADVFAVGVLGWEMLTGERAFAEAPLSTRATSAARLASPSSLRGEVPAAVDEALRRAFDPDPTRRWSDAGQLADALAALRASPSEVAAWVGLVAEPTLAERRAMVRELAVDDGPTDDGSTATVEPSAARIDVPKRTSRRSSPWLAAALLLAIVLGWVGGRSSSVGNTNAAPAAPRPIIDLPAASPSPIVAPMAASTSASSVPSSVEPPRKPKPVAPVVPADKCSPPYTIDERGVRTFKVECL